MNRLPRIQWPGLTTLTVLRLKGEIERRLFEAKGIRAKASSVREMVAATEVIHQLEEWLALAVEHLAAIKRERGWPTWYTVSAGGETPPPDGRSASDGPGVAGAAPPPVTGQGRPAFVRAGSAADAPGRSGDSGKAPTKAPLHPAEPAFFCPADEGISTQNNGVGGIHYANY